MSRTESTYLFSDTDTDPEIHTASATAHLLDELVLHGHRAGQDEPDPRPLPEPDVVRGQLGAMVEAFAAMLTGTRLEDDLADLLWSFVNMFHRKTDRVERELDLNEQAQRRGQAEQDGSEVKSVVLEGLINQGLSLIERRNAFELVRDHAAELFEVTTGSFWRPRVGSKVNHRALTASMIDSREFLAARRRTDTEVLPLPARASPSPAAPTATITCASGTPSTRSAPSTRAWCCCMAAARTAPSASPPAGPISARSRRLSSSLTGPATATPRPSSATTGCWSPCRSASSSSRAPASPPTSPTRPRSSASRSGASRATAPLRRRFSRSIRYRPPAGRRSLPWRKPETAGLTPDPSPSLCRLPRRIVSAPASPPAITVTDRVGTKAGCCRAAPRVELDQCAIRQPPT
jgi:hypothetical protein